MLKRKLICLLAAAVTAVSMPAVVLADDEIIFVEDENTGEVTVDTSSDDNEAEAEDDEEDKSEDKDKEDGDKKTSGSKKKSEEKTSKDDEEEIINPFKDVDEGAWYYDYVLDTYEKGLMAGIADDQFAPDSTLTRGMIASIVYRMEGSPDIEYKALFTDVPDGLWYTDGIIWAAENGIFAGYGNGLCGPNDYVTVEQLASILHRYAGAPSADIAALNKYSDLMEVSDYAKNSMAWAVTNDMTQGQKLHPKTAATRAEAAKMFSLL